MDNRLDRIEGKLDDVRNELVEVKIGYQEHERRSLANEQGLEILKEHIKPLQDVLLQIRLLLRILILGGAISGAIAAILELIEKL